MNKEMDFLKRIIAHANEISDHAFEVKNKGGENDLVTNLDLEIESYLIKEIKEAYPDFDIVSEEYNSNKNVTDNCFIIDPIDGTINFANDLPLWGIQIACVKNGNTVASIISLHRINELYTADETGAYLNGKKINVRTVPIKNTLYAIDGSNNLPSMQRMRAYSSSRRNFGGVCVSMAFMSCGRIHGAVFRSDKPWDYAPGLYLCKMAGASVCDIPGFHAAAMNDEFLNILKNMTAKKDNKSNIFILHSLNGDTLKMWGKDVKEEFGGKEIDVYTPDFPIRAESSYVKFKEILKTYYDDGTLNENSIVVAHSIGNPYFIKFCKEFEYKPKAYIAVAPSGIYESKLDRTDYIVEVSKQALPKPEDIEYIKNNITHVYCLYSDESSGNTEEFLKFIEDASASEVYLKYYDHFDGYHRIYKIPELNELINELL